MSLDHSCGPELTIESLKVENLSWLWSERCDNMDLEDRGGARSKPCRKAASRSRRKQGSRSSPVPAALPTPGSQPGKTHVRLVT